MYETTRQFVYAENVKYTKMASGHAQLEITAKYKIGKPAHGKISTKFILNLICDLRI
jgi:hypothetical protein